MTLSGLCYGGVGGRELLRSLRRADNQVWGSRPPKLHQQQGTSKNSDLREFVRV